MVSLCSTDTVPLEGGVRKGAWSREEDRLLRECVEKYGVGNWHLVPSRAGLRRCRKSCRLRWLNYLCPKVKRGEFSEGERDLIIRLHRLLGNRWSLIAGRIPGRTANDVKNYWNSRMCKPQSVALMTEKKPIAPIRKKLAKAAREDQEPIRRPTVLVVKPQAHRIKMKPPRWFRKSDAASSRSSQLGEFRREDHQCSPGVLQNNLPAEKPAIHESKPDDDGLMLSGGGCVFTSSDQAWDLEAEADLEMWNLLQPDMELHDAQWDQAVDLLDAEIWEYR